MSENKITTTHLAALLALAIIWLPFPIFAGGAVYLAIHSLEGWGWMIWATFAWLVLTNEVKIKFTRDKEKSK